MAGRKSINTELREILTSPVVVRIGSRSLKLTMLSAIVAMQADKALRGSDRAAQAVLEVGRWPGVLDGTKQTIDVHKLTDDELNTFERLLAKSQITVRDEDDE